MTEPDECTHPVVILDRDTAHFPDAGVMEVRGECDSCGTEVQETYYKERQEEVEDSVRPTDEQEKPEATINEDSRTILRFFVNRLLDAERSHHKFIENGEKAIIDMLGLDQDQIEDFFTMIGDVAHSDEQGVDEFMDRLKDTINLTIKESN